MYVMETERRTGTENTSTVVPAAVNQEGANDLAKHTAWESKDFYENGNPKSQRRIGSSVPWAVVALVAIFFGKAAVSIPPSFWDFFKR